MIIPSTTGNLLAPTASADANADIHPGSGSSTINSTAITTTNNGSMNALTMFLFWFFLCSTGVLVVFSIVILRRLRLREQARRAQKDKTAAATSASLHAKDMDEENTIAGSTVSLAPVLVSRPSLFICTHTRTLSLSAHR
jgi:hypothetical protein